MEARINLPNLDPAVGTEDFNSVFIIWLSNIVDILNQDIDTIENAINNLITAAGTDVGGSGAGPLTVTVTGLTASGFVDVQLISSSNPVTISTVSAGTNQFSITFSADPGASAIIVYQAYTAQP